LVATNFVEIVRNIVNKELLNWIVKFGLDLSASIIFMVDSTFNIAKKGVQTVVLMVVNQWGKPVPIAYGLTDSSSTSSWITFFETRARDWRIQMC